MIGSKIFCECAIVIEAFSTAKKTLQRRQSVDSALAIIKPINPNLLLFKIKTTKKKKKSSSSSLLKLILYLKTPTQAKNYTIYSNFATQGKITIRAMGYQLMLSDADPEFLVNTLRLLAPVQLQKHLKTLAPSAPPTSSTAPRAPPPPPFQDRTNRRIRPRKYDHSSPAKQTTGRRSKTSYSNRSPAAASPIASQKYQQDDRLAVPSPIAAPKPSKRTRSSSSSTAATTAATSSTTAATSTATSASQLPDLSYDQEIAFNHFEAGRNIFITGPGGTGKSVLIRACVDWCRRHHKTVSVTATTGVAACNVQGETIHSWSGVNGKDIEQARAEAAATPTTTKAGQHRRLGESAIRIVQKMQRGHIDRWTKIDVLIIDEISMMDDTTMDVLDLIGQFIRSNNQPYGGIQVLLSGDFLQLPPVVRSTNGVTPKVTFCFESVCFLRTFPQYSNSKSNSSRTTTSGASLATRINRKTYQDLRLLHTKKASRKKALLQQFKQQQQHYTNESTGAIVLLTTVHRQSKDQAFVQLLHRARLGVVTADDLQVLRRCTTSTTTLTHEDISHTHLCTHVRQAYAQNKKELAKLNGFHVTFKAQDYVSNNNLVRVLDGICRAPSALELAVGAQVILVKTIDASAGLVNGTRGVVQSFTHQTQQPVVKFTNGVERTILPETWTLKNNNGNHNAVAASRKQLPLDLAWAISIHKSQGMTLDCATLDLTKTFEYGQAYVALSRLKSLKGLRVRGTLDGKTFRACPKVLTFYNNVLEEEVEW